jgi:hypothetical protein
MYFYWRKNMPTIKIPENVTLANPDGSIVKDDRGNEVQIDFVKSFLTNTVANDQKFGKDLSSLHASIDVCAAFKDKNPGDEVLLSQDVWTKLKDVVKEPTSPYNVAVMRQCKSFFDAILDPSKA